MRASLALCGVLLATPAFAQQSWMVGTWFGYGQPNDKSQMWIERASADGKFHVHHRACERGQPRDATNDGTWSLKGDVITIRVEKVDDTPIAPRTDIYRVLSHSNTRQSYRYEATGFVYNSRRVPGDFQMPACDLAS